MSNIVEYVMNLRDNLSPAITGATSHVQKMEGALSGAKSMAMSLGAAMGVAFGAYQIGNFIKSGVEAYHALEQSQAKVEANLKSTQHAAGIGMEDIVKWTSTLSSHIKASKGEITDMASQLLTFTPITKDVFERSMGMVADIAKQTGHELSETAIMYGKALNDPTDGLKKMQRYGVIFDDTQKATIEKLQASGKLIEAQKSMMDAIAKSGYEGVATSMFNADPISKFNKMLGYAKITVGEYVTEILKSLMPTFEMLAGGIKNVFTFLKEHNTAISYAIGLYATYKGIMLGIIAVEKIAILWKGISVTATQLMIAWDLARAEGMSIVTAAQWALNAAMDANPIGLIIMAVAALVVGIIALSKHFGGFTNMLNGVWEIIKAFAVGVGKAFWGLGEIIAGALTFNPKLIAKGLTDTVNSVKEAGRDISNAWNNSDAQAAAKAHKSLIPGKEGKLGLTGKPGEVASNPATKAEGQKTINIHVAYNAPLIQGFTISTTNLKEGLQNLKAKVSDILVEATHDSLMVADH